MITKAEGDEETRVSCRETSKNLMNLAKLTRKNQEIQITLANEVRTPVNDPLNQDNNSKSRSKS